MTLERTGESGRMRLSTDKQKAQLNFANHMLSELADQIDREPLIQEALENSFGLVRTSLNAFASLRTNIQKWRNVC